MTNVNSYVYATTVFSQFISMYRKFKNNEIDISSLVIVTFPFYNDDVVCKKCERTHL